jgi:hypothetical protein
MEKPSDETEPQNPVTFPKNPTSNIAALGTTPSTHEPLKDIPDQT